MKFWVLAGVALIQLAASSLVLAERPMTDKMKRYAAEHQVKENKQNLTGWDGILFFCHDISAQAPKDICDQTYVNAAFLAETAKINLTKADDGFQVGFESVVGELLVLEVKLNSADKLGAIHANVRAYVAYSDAVQKKHFGDTERKDARMIPRSGDLIFWEQSVLGVSSGTAHELVVPMAQGIEQRLKEFFADYLKAQH